MASGNPKTFQQDEIVRPAANFSPSLWGDLFSSVSTDYNQPGPARDQVFENYGVNITTEALMEEVRGLILRNEMLAAEKLSLIDNIERLGISYHFEKEIEQQIQYLSLENIGDHDLHTVALYFRLLRQHGHHISSGIFEKFTETDGKFKSCLENDTRGLLSLFEAANLRTHGEDILEEAPSFTTCHLIKSINNNNDPNNSIIISSPLKEEIEHALEQCMQRGIPRVEAHRYISIYEQFESRNDSLLRLAKLDFNSVQLLHRKELCELSRWWKELDLVSKLSYVRDRVVECYFWTLGVYYEPKYSRARIMLAKTIAMISVIDDTYDSYGTVDELQIFTDAIQRWDIKEMQKLPDYMKICYKAVLDLYEQYDEELSDQERSFAVHYAKATMKEIVRSYNIESKWFNMEGYMPSFSDYKTNGFITSTYYLLAATSFIGMTSASREAFDWLINKPKIQVANVTICRFVDDIATYEIEKKRGQSGTGIECYMKDYGVSEEEAMKEFNNIAEKAWKDINGEIFKEKSVSVEILKRIVNLSRLIDVVYKHNQDGYTNPEKLLKPLITALLIVPFAN
ncbi:hypothetical protein ACP275_01G033100 [Erythranthe tilingii]